jgi:glycosyltransferase involved in cell wall biosynthesis
MENPKVTVVIPAYNHEQYVGEAIQSVLDQTFQDFELIIINDGSTDGTESEILKFRDDRIRYYQQENRGLSATLNRGIGLATGGYFNFLPSDDAFYTEKLEMQLRIFEKDAGLGLVFAYPQLIDATGKEIKDDPVTDWAAVPYETKEEIFPALFERDFLSAPTALIRMECFERVGLFDTSLKTAQDYDMWMRILKYYDLRLIKKPLLKYDGMAPT